MRVRGVGVWTVRLAVAGLRYRRGRSVLVASVVVAAVAAAVLGPAYARAAQQSVLRDALTSAASWQTGFSVRASGTIGDVEADPSAGDGALTSDRLARVSVADLALVARGAMAPGDHYGTPVGAVETPVTPAVGDADAASGRVVYRDGYCRVLRPVAGRCPRRTGEVLASVRSRLPAGTRIPITGTVDSPILQAGHATLTVVGLYRPPAAQGPYWFNHGYFGERVQTAGGVELRVLDGFFGSEDTVHLVFSSEFVTSVDFPLRIGTTDLSTLPAMEHRLAAGTRTLRARGFTVDTPLTSAVLPGVRGQNGQILTSALLIAVQLALLCVVVLFGVVRSATSDRGTELGLAKLRGLSGRQVAGFGLADLALLVVGASPLGLLAGWGLTELYALAGLPPGVHAELRWPMLVAAAAGCGGALVAAVLGIRQAVRAPTNDLLRRVPSRVARWRSNALDGVLIAGALAASYQVLAGGSGQLGLLSGFLLAMVAGVLAGRAVPVLMARRVARARRRGRLPAMLAAARLARRPGVPRTVALVAVAVALLAYGVVAWDVGARNRDLRAAAEVGAPVVYDVQADSVTALTAAVDRADPGGRQAMAVARTVGGVGAGTTEVLAVDTRRLAAVASWPPSYGAGDVTALARRLRPATPAALTVRGPVVTAAVRTSAASPGISLVALLVDGHREQHAVDLGPLAPGRSRLTGTASGCAAGCRLAGFDVFRGPRAPDRITATFTLTGLLDGPTGRVVPAGFGHPGGWHPADGVDGEVTSTLRPDGSGLDVSFASDGGEDLRILHSDAPFPQPAAVVGRIGTGPGAFHAAGLYGLEQAYRPVAHARTLPSITDGILIDLRDADLVTVTGNAVTPPRYQVWTAAGAPAALRSRLAAAGLRITGTRTAAADSARLGRQGPGLTLRLYLMAAAAALLLAGAVLLLAGTVQARPEVAELTALRVAGLTTRQLRRAGHREYAVTVGVAWLVGLLAGTGGAELALPRIPLFSDGSGPPPVRLPEPWWPATTALLAALTLAATATLVLRTNLRRAQPEQPTSGS